MYKLTEELYLRLKRDLKELIEEIEVQRNV